MYTGLSLSLESPVPLFSTPVGNLLLCGWILSTTGNLTTGNLTHSIKGISSMLSHNRCYGFRPLTTAPVHIGNKEIFRLSRSCFSHNAKSNIQFVHICMRKCILPKLCVNDQYTYGEERSVVFKVHPHRVHLERLDITVGSVRNRIIREAGGFKLAVRLHRGCCQGHCGSLLFHIVRCVIVVVARKEDKLFFWLCDFGREWTHCMDKNLLHS